jgi:hydroxyacylglutathione hydrolase
MKIKQFRYGLDNFSYLIHGDRFAIAIDGGAVHEIFFYVENMGLNLKYITETHSHPDHTAGTHELLKGSGAAHLNPRMLINERALELGGDLIHIYHTPGHTRDSVTFQVDDKLITGDTLFNGTVGNCFSGDLRSFYQSIKMILEFPDEFIVYAGHDYVKESLDFAKRLEPNNVDIDLYLKKYDPDHVFSTLLEERKINPYLRFNEASVISLLEKRGLPVETEYERWESLMSIE